MRPQTEMEPGTWVRLLSDSHAELPSEEFVDAPAGTIGVISNLLMPDGRSLVMLVERCQVEQKPYYAIGENLEAIERPDEYSERWWEVPGLWVRFQKDRHARLESEDYPESLPTQIDVPAGTVGILSRDNLVLLVEQTLKDEVAYFVPNTGDLEPIKRPGAYRTVDGDFYRDHLVELEQIATAVSSPTTPS